MILANKLLFSRFEKIWIPWNYFSNLVLNALILSWKWLVLQVCVVYKIYLCNAVNFFFTICVFEYIYVNTMIENWKNGLKKIWLKITNIIFWLPARGLKTRLIDTDLRYIYSILKLYLIQIYEMPLYLLQELVSNWMLVSILMYVHVTINALFTRIMIRTNIFCWNQGTMIHQD
jgi:hypothetical protein